MDYLFSTCPCEPKKRGQQQNKKADYGCLVVSVTCDSPAWVPLPGHSVSPISVRSMLSVPSFWGSPGSGRGAP